MRGMQAKKIQQNLQKRKHLFVAIMPALLVFFSMQAAAQNQASVQVNGETGRHIAISDSQAISVDFVGSQDAVQSLQSGQAQPLSLDRGDFDEDGIEDLVAGYSSPKGKGMVVLFRGNLDAFAPQSEGSWLAIGRGQFPPTFLSIGATFPLSAAADFLGAGNFLGSGHLDVVAAARGGNTLYFLAGNGSGNLGVPEPIQLPGALSAMAAGRFGASNSRSTVIVGVSGPKPAVLVYSGSSQGLSPTGQFALMRRQPLSPSTMLMGMAGPMWSWLPAGPSPFCMHPGAWPASQNSKTLSLPISAVAATTGFLCTTAAGDGKSPSWMTRAAVHVVAHGGFDSRG